MNKNRLLYVLSLLSVLISSISLSFSIMVFSSFDKHQNVKDFLSSVCQIKSVSEDGVNSSGTGFVIKDNLIVTNYHVVTFGNKQAKEIMVRFPNEETYSLVSIKTIDKDNDVAFLYFNNLGNVKPLDFSASLPDYGDDCFAICNTNNYGISLIKGTITIPLIKIESTEYNDYFVQANIDVYPGSSGGCLLDADYKCIGVLTFRLKDSSNNPVYGYGYAIPFTRIIPLLDI